MEIILRLFIKIVFRYFLLKNKDYFVLKWFVQKVIKAKIDIEQDLPPNILDNTYVFFDMILSAAWQTKCLFHPGQYLSSSETYILIVVEGIEHVVGKAGEEVDEEPGLHVVDPYDGRVAYHFTSGPHIRGVEVEDDVNEEYHIDDWVDHK